MPKPHEPDPADGPACEHETAARAAPKGKGCRCWPWRLLKARTFGKHTTTCPDCDGELTLRALVTDADTIHRILTHLGLPTDIPTAAPARGPPYYRAAVRRLRPGAPGAPGADPQDLLP